MLEILNDETDNRTTRELKTRLDFLRSRLQSESGSDAKETEAEIFSIETRLFKLHKSN